MLWISRVLEEFEILKTKGGWVSSGISSLPHSSTIRPVSSILIWLVVRVMFGRSLSLWRACQLVPRNSLTPRPCRDPLKQHVLVRSFAESGGRGRPSKKEKQVNYFPPFHSCILASSSLFSSFLSNQIINPPPFRFDYWLRVGWRHTSLRRRSRLHKKSTELGSSWDCVVLLGMDMTNFTAIHIF